MVSLDNHIARKQPWLKIYDELGVTPPAFDDRPIASHIAQHAADRPEAPALLYFDKVFSFAEYDKYISKLANAFKELGIQKGDVVGLLMPNIPQYAFAVGACSRLGAIGTGLSPLSAPAELAHQLKDAGVKLVVALSDLMPKMLAMEDVPDCLATTIITSATDHLSENVFKMPKIANVEVLAYKSVIHNQSDACPQTPSHWNDTFMIQYTGGTTGRPKGAQLSIRNIMHNSLMNESLSTPKVTGKEIWASPFPLFHIAGLYSLAYAARIGALFYLVPDPRNLAQMIGYMQKFPPTMVAAVPALTEMLLATPEFASVDFSRLNTWGSGAAPISKETVKKLVERIGENKLSDSFGMTETSAGYICNPPKRYKYGSVGIPLPDTDVRIMDVATGTVEMPVGEPGEICASGPQVMKGYLNLPDETAIALRSIYGRTYMYSGDVGYMDEEGFLFLCDRAKDMLIVGGFKVFSVEVEDKLSALSCVKISAVIGAPDKDRPGNDIVHLFVQLSEEHKVRDDDELRIELSAFFKENLAVYKKPKHIHFVDTIPLTPIGKIDKKALRAKLV